MGKGKKKGSGLKFVCLFFSVLAVLGLVSPVFWSWSSEDASISEASYFALIGGLVAVCIILSFLTLVSGPKHHVLSFFLLLILTLIALGIILLCLYLAVILALIDDIYLLILGIPAVLIAIWIILFWAMSFKCYR